MKKICLLLLIFGFTCSAAHAQSERLSRTNKKTYTETTPQKNNKEDRNIRKMDTHPKQDNAQMRPTSDVDRNNTLDPNNPASPTNPTNPNVPANQSNNPNTTAPNNGSRNNSNGTNGTTTTPQR